MSAAPGGYAQTTRGITVRVASFYLEEQSAPEQRRFVWAYRVTIANESAETVQLLRRTWRITDGRGRTQMVQGDGVVGAQPVLEPGESFEYTSGTPLDTPSGFMGGHYHMVAHRAGHMVAHGPGPAFALADSGGDAFDVVIPTFSLDSPHEAGRVH
jgi:ApaG protein